MIVEQRTDFPFIVLSPQCPSDAFWESQVGRLDSLLEEISATYDVDESRIYLTGLSMGGYGAWHYALREPTRFAAVVPIAGGYIQGSDEVPENICVLQDVPMWVFHGAGDKVVLPRQSEVLVDALRACPSKVRFTLYPGAAHDESWKLAYADPELYAWLLAQRLEE
jgi:predicted peptidase